MGKFPKELKVKIEVKSGMHIGGISEYEIGGIDNVVIKDPEGYPYIPGSSLKGRMRSILEELGVAGKSVDELSEDGKGSVVCDCGKCVVCRVFGFSNKKDSKLSLVVVRDLFVVKDEDKKDPQDFLEIKAENSIVRNSEQRGRAVNPRFTERVKRGTKFEGEIIILSELSEEDIINSEQSEGNNSGNGVNKERAIKSLNRLREIANKVGVSYDGNSIVRTTISVASKLLSDYYYLGGSGTRGYGKVAIEIEEI